jgi:outer membrane protein assembly factor BamB
MDSPASRRRYLQFVGGAGVASLSGCMGVTDDGTGTERTAGLTGASMFRYTPARTGGPPDSTGPIDSVSEGWAVEIDENLAEWLVVVDDTVYLVSHDNAIYALAASDGSEQWSVAVDGRIASSPAVVDDTVYVGRGGGNLCALAANDGTEQWRFETGDRWVWSTVVVDETLYIGTSNGTVYALIEQ